MPTNDFKLGDYRWRRRLSFDEKPIKAIEIKNTIRTYGYRQLRMFILFCHLVTFFCGGCL